VEVPYKSNACFGFDATTGWTFFDLTHLHDEFRHATLQLLTLEALPLSFLRTITDCRAFLSPDLLCHMSPWCDVGTRP
jgi:hypothetical protein